MDFSDFLRPGDYATNAQGTLYRVKKVNRVNTVCEDERGKLWNVRGTLKKYDGDPGWSEAPKLRPGTIVRVKRDSGMYSRQWFKQYSLTSLFVVTDADETKAKFVPLGGVGLPATTRGYNCGPTALDIVDPADVLR